MTELAGETWDPTAAALAGQRAENEWVGMQCGIMDQLSSAVGQDGHALLIDCQSLEVEPIPIPDTVEVVILDTRAERKLVGSEYNDRRSESASAAAALSWTKPAKSSTVCAPCSLTAAPSSCRPKALAASCALRAAMFCDGLRAG